MQEAVYLVMPELCLRKTFAKVIFLYSNTLEKRYRIFRRKEDFDELSDDSTDAFQQNMLERHLNRLDRAFQNDKFAVTDSLVLQSFDPFIFFSQSQNPNYTMTASCIG